MKSSIIVILMILMIGGAFADPNSVNERNAIKVALNNGNVSAVKRLIESTKDFEVWARCLEALPKLNDENSSKTLLRSALENPHLWEIPSLEDGETYSARAGTFARTKEVLKAFGLNVSSVDLTRASQRMKVAEQL